MWPFSKKRTIADSGILVGATDHHSHILPGVDDGVESMDEALRILASFEATGVKELWLTPHIMEDIPNTPARLKARFQELTAAYDGNISLHLAAEYMIDSHLRKLLDTIAKSKRAPMSQAGDTQAHGGNSSLLPIGSKGNHLLVETSYYNPPMRLHETLRQIKSLGYMYMDNNEYIELHNEGVKFQLNLPSICGAYGSTVKKRAQWLLKNNLYDAIGSDTHCEEGVLFIMGNKLEKKYISALLMLKNSTL